MQCNLIKIRTKYICHSNSFLFACFSLRNKTQVY